MMGPAGCLWVLICISWDGQIGKHPSCLIPIVCGTFRTGR